MEQITAHTTEPGEKEKRKADPEKSLVEQDQQATKEAYIDPKTIPNDSPLNVVERADAPEAAKPASAEASAWARKKPDAEVTIADDRFTEQQPIKTKEAGKASPDRDDPFASKDKAEAVRPVPANIDRDYLKVGDKYHYPNKPELQAFQDNGNKLETKSDSHKVAADLVAIANVRGWEQLNVKGTDEFKRQVWLEAQMKGIDVKGFKPTDADKALLEKRQRETSANTVEVGKASDKKASPEPLKADNKSQATPAPTTDKKTPEKAPEPAKAHQEPKQDKAEAKTAKAEPAPEKSEHKDKADALRNMERKEAVKAHPELVNAYAIVRAAELVAQREMTDKGDREKYVGQVKEFVAKGIERGEKIPEVKLNERRQERDTGQELSR